MLKVFHYLVCIWKISLTVHAAFSLSGYGEEEAKKMIYNVCCERYFGFGCEIEVEASNKLKGRFICSFSFLLMFFSSLCYLFLIS